MKNIQDRYCIGFYNRDERFENEEIYFRCAGNVVTSYIIDNIDLFNVRKLETNKEGDYEWVTLKTSELIKVKSLLTYYIYDNKQEILDFIDKCMDYSLWTTSCTCCDTINLNVIPYTYRGNENISRVYNCLNCSGLPDKYAVKIKTTMKENGVEAAVRLALAEDKFIFN